VVTITDLDKLLSFRFNNITVSLLYWIKCNIVCLDKKKGCLGI